MMLTIKSIDESDNRIYCVMITCIKSHVGYRSRDVGILQNYKGYISIAGCLEILRTPTPFEVLGDLSREPSGKDWR